MQRHQHRIDRNTRKGTFAGNALFLGGLGDCGGLHAEKGGKINCCYCTRHESRARGKAQKKPFKSVAYLNEKHSRSSYVKRMRQKSSAANDKTAP
ncbi:hypothetical protein [Paraburkholderia sp. HD33-4]|uniref:hypothetical protein n=1 Tax=Paraburkholderia sp. HD33-4 TaxID=2883242 RepID=UPI001F317675|nr:hypothetical protein [Paraburkholderia sp. HD33-4]